MNEQKREIFEKTLKNPYDHEQYIKFLRELLSGMKLVAPNKAITPYNTFAAAVTHYYHIGTYVGPMGNKIALFSVCLKNDKNIENARSMQRNFVKSLLEEGSLDGALVAFHTDNAPDKWRLSLVRLDYEFSKGKLSEKLTPAKRYSYLVGKGEPCHTAEERLFPIFETDDAAPSLDELEEAFSVEAVTKDFFDQYKAKYIELKESLEDNNAFVKESKSRGFTSEQFAKKLMGQIVFLYFIQKKGWLGVDAFPSVLTEREYKNGFFKSGSKPKELMPFVYKKAADGNFYRDNKALLNLSDSDEAELSKCVKGSPWGSGPRNFMRKIFEACKQKNQNYFDDYLEPLFYTGLNQNRGDNAFFAPLHRRIPFLNGGLFEEMDGYDWEHNDFSIPNEIFSNADEKGRDADGILDVFDRFNFTIAEDEPMEREVAIDPEMLGKVFENLLDVKDRKSKGAFYTPREIVHYMCQESLINYLSTKTGIDEEDIRKFIIYGEYFRDEDVKKTIYVERATGKVIDEKDRFSVESEMAVDKTKDLEIPESIFSFKKNVNRLDEIDKLLSEVKVVDPAVGSGAFALGMLNEIVKARDTITSYMAIEMSTRDRFFLHNSRNAYSMKRNTIKNSIFACDIEASATDITKLRLWLSLVIDNQIMDKEDESLGYSTKPRPLPNLDCNIICGNSLVDEFHGNKLITENDTLGNSLNSQRSIFDSKLTLQLNELINLQSKLYDEKDHVAKDSLKNQIQDIYNDIVVEQLHGNDDLIDSYYEEIQKPSKPFVLWQISFPKVFRDNGGFDIVIGNPPYGAKIPKDQIKYFQKNYFCSKTISGVQKGSTDSFTVFIEKGLKLIKNHHSTLCFIVPMSVTSSDSMTALHNELEESCETIRIASFSNRPRQIFDAACIRTSIIFLKKESVKAKHLLMTKLIRRNSNDTILDVVKQIKFVEAMPYKLPGRYPKIGSDIEADILKKMSETKTTLLSYKDDDGEPVYYRAAGGRYFNVVTDYSTGSTQEKPCFVSNKFVHFVAAVLSTSLFWVYQQIYTDGLHIKQSELDTFPFPSFSSITNEQLKSINNLYNKYTADIESNVRSHTATDYNISSFKEYKLVKSKHLIDELDDMIDPLYGLSKEQIEFIKNFEIDIRMKG